MTLRTDVSALYVDPRGPYPKLVVDWWDETRDARGYAGPNPVVAHPPCQLWGPFAVVNFRRWGGEHNRPGNDGGCFAAALSSVLRYGGVLEHPAKSKAWVKYGLAAPAAKQWTASGHGWVCEVWQSAYGHRANKATWLFYVGPRPPDCIWEKPIGTHQCGYRDQRGKDRNKPTLSKREASETPPLFAHLLIRLASTARKTQ